MDLDRVPRPLTRVVSVMRMVVIKGFKDANKKMNTGPAAAVSAARVLIRQSALQMAQNLEPLGGRTSGTKDPEVSLS